MGGLLERMTRVAGRRAGRITIAAWALASLATMPGIAPAATVADASTSSTPPHAPITYPTPMTPRVSAATRVQPVAGPSMPAKYLRQSDAPQCSSAAAPPLALQNTKVKRGPVCGSAATTRKPIADAGYGHGHNATAAWDADTQPVQASLASDAVLAGGPQTYTSPDWGQQQPSTSPPARYGASLAYDSVHGVAVLFGGTDGHGAYLNDTWTWNGSVWTQVNPSPTPSVRAYAHMAWDAAHNDIVLFGGYSASGGDVSDTWTWNGTSWTLQQPATSPRARGDGAFAYDPATSSVVLFGGDYQDASGDHDLGDTWSWNGSAWTQLAPSAAPSARSATRMAYDTASATMVLFGGIVAGASVGLGDTWTFDGANWTQQHPAQSPNAREDHMLAYDAGLNGVQLFGGYAWDSAGNPLSISNDTWLWNGSNWLLASGIASPPARMTAAMTYDDSMSGLVLFGGYSGNTLGDTWNYITGSNATPVIPSVSVTTDRGGNPYGRGDIATYTITAGNAGTSVITNGSIADTLSSGQQVATALPMTITDTGTGGVIACSGQVTCSITASSLSVRGVTIPAGDSVTVNYSTIAVGTERMCSTTTDAATASSVTGTHSPVAANPAELVCDVGLGSQPWWYYTTAQTVAAESAMAVNMANGNMVVTAQDDTAIPAHGSLSFAVERTYNSEESGAQALTGILARGWLLTVGQAGTVAGQTGVSGMMVPAQESASASLPVDVIDSTGTRLMFTPKTPGSPIDVNPLTPSSGSLGPVAPRILTLGSGYTRICVDQTYTPPLGVHLSMWRYVELTSGSSPCVPAAGTTPAVLGFAAERTDRMRYEFGADGHLLDLEDGYGNELRYAYDASTPGHPGMLRTVIEPASGRALHLDPETGGVKLTDPAGRVTHYAVDGSSHLTAVTNPDGTQVSYAYGGSCAGSGAAADQLCSVTDARGSMSSMAYAASSPQGTAYAGPPRLHTFTDPAGTVTTYTLNTSPDNATVDTGNRRTFLPSFDDTGRPGYVYQGSTGGTWSHVTDYRWDVSDPSLRPCRQPDFAPDNNLCHISRLSLDGQANGDDTSYVYDQEGQPIVTAQCVAKADPGPGQSIGFCGSAQRITTNSRRAEYVEVGGSVVTYSDTVAGNGAVTSQSGGGASGARGDANTVFVLSDLTQSLTPKGNAAGAGYAGYLTGYVLDDLVTAAANQHPSTPPCADPLNIASNSGARCEADGPSFDGGVHPHSVEQWSYNSDGTIATHITPLAVTTAPAGQNPKVETYTYYADTDRDLSGTTSAGGWVKGVTDQYGNFVAVAYDAAGNPVRTWDRDATKGYSLPAFPGTVASPAAPHYSEKLHGLAGSATAYSSPWRYVLAQRDPLGNLTTLTVDQNGDQLTMRPPLGNAGNISAYDTVQTYDRRGLVLTVQTPQEAANGAPPMRYTYDAFGNRTVQEDANNVYTTYQYDVLGRPTGTTFSRGTGNGPAPTPSACRASQGSDAPIPLGLIVCFTSKTYDGVDNVISSTDANGEVTTYAYDGLHERLTTVSPRYDGRYTTLTSAQVYDIDGNVTDQCPPDEFVLGAGSCTATGAYSVHHAYDALDRQVSTTTYRSAGAAPSTTSVHRDADGNVTSQTDPNQKTTTYTFDLLDRRTAQTVPHDAQNNVYYVTTWSYSPAGDVLAVIQPGTNRIIASSYDADHRVVDTVQAADSATASIAGTLTVYDPGTLDIRTRRVYDADGEVVATYAPNAFGPTAQTPDPSGTWKYLPDPTYMSRTDYDLDGRPIATYSPRYGGSAQADPAGSIQTVQCPTNPPQRPFPGVLAYPGSVGVCVTHTTYDNAGNVVRTTLPTSGGNDNRYVAYTYTDDRLVQSVETPNPQPGATPARVVESSYGYDGDGRKVVTADAGQHTASTSYTADGLVASSSDPGAHTTSFTYDPNGNKLTSTDPLTLTTGYAYFTDNLLQSATDPAGDKTSYAYDPVGNVSQTYSPSANSRDANNTGGVPTSNIYFDDNLLHQVTTPVSPDGSLARTTSYTYDGAGRKVTRAITQSDGQNGANEQFTYYPDDRQAQQIGVTTSYHITTTYDADGNPLSITDNTGSGSTVTSSFYADDLVARVDDGNATTVESYDALRNPDLVQQTVDGRGAQYTQHYTYGDAGMVTQLDALAGSPSGTASTKWNYDPQGRPTSEVRPGGSKVNYGYNSDNTLNNIQLLDPSGKQTGTWTYGWDNDRRQTSGSVSMSTGASSQNASWTIGYDNAGRVTSFNDGVDPAETVRWNADSDRTSWTTAKGTATATYNANDSMATLQIGTTSNATYSYTAFGEIANDGCLDYGYDAFERLNSSTLDPKPGAVCTGVVGGTYTHDGLDRMRTDNEGGATNTVLGYIGLGQAVGVETLTTTPTPTDTAYALSPSGERIGLTKFASTGNTPEQLFDNGQGTINLSTQPNGMATCAATFDPFGQPLKTGNNVSPCSYGSTSNDFFYRGGRYSVSAQGYQFGSREYQPGIGSFLQPDVYRSSSGSGGDLGLQTDPLTRNLYGYSGGDPVNRWDPSGHCPDGDCSKAGDPQLYASNAAAQQQQQAADESNYNASVPLGPTHHTGDWNPPGPLKVVPQEVPLQLPGTDYYVHINAYSGHCYDCDGATFTKDNRTYAWSSVQNTFVCGQHDAAASSCGEDHTYAWQGGNKFVEYDDGVRTGIHAAISTVVSIAAGVLVTVGCGIATGGMGSVGCIVAGSAVAGAVSGYMDCGWKCAAEGALVGAASGAAGFGVAKLAGAGIEALAGAEGATAAEGGSSIASRLAETCAVNSFTAATPVLMADGSRRAISDVQPGDFVVAGDAQQDSETAEPVQRVIVGHGLKHLVAVGVAGETIEATFNHPFWVVEDQRFEWASQLKVGQDVWLDGGDTATVKTLKAFDAVTTVYNLSIADVHTFFVGGTPVLVHNSCSPGLQRIFTEGVGGSVRGRSIANIRSTLMEEGFSMTKARGRGYLFQNGLNESVRIMQRSGGWDLRVQNAFGNYLDEFGNVAKDAASAHGISVSSY